MRILKTFEDYDGKKFIIRLTTKSKRYQVLPERYDYSNMCSALCFDTRVDAINYINRQIEPWVKRERVNENLRKPHWENYYLILSDLAVRKLRHELQDLIQESARYDKLAGDRVRHHGDCQHTSTAIDQSADADAERDKKEFEYEKLIYDMAYKIKLPIELFRSGNKFTFN